MNLNQIQCPNCNANLQVPDNQNRMFCTYCGTQIQLDDGATVIRYIDEARIREIEYQRELRQHEEDERRRIEQERLQAEENNKNARKKWWKFFWISELIFLIFCFVLRLVLLYMYKSPNDFTVKALWINSFKWIFIPVIHIKILTGLYPKKLFGNDNSTLSIGFKVFLVDLFILIIDSVISIKIY